MIIEICDDHSESCWKISPKQLRTLAEQPHERRREWVLTHLKPAAVHSDEDVDIALVCDSWGSHGTEDETEWQEEVRALLEDA